MGIPEVLSVAGEVLGGAGKPGDGVGPDSPEGFRTVREICSRANFFPSRIQTVASIETMILYVEMNAGVSLMAENCRLTSNPNVRFIPLKDIFFETVTYWHPDAIPQSVQDSLEATVVDSWP